MVEFRAVGVDVPGRDGLLSAITFDIGPGDRVALVGPSGSGKSTLLALLGGLLEPTRGELNRADIDERRNVAWVFQQTYILGYRTVQDNAALAALADGTPWETCNRRATEALAQVGLSHRAETLAGRISGGERQRLGVARALVGNRQLILADEPTASLDADLVEAVSSILVEQTPPTSAVVIATHDERVANKCHRIVRLDQGQLLSE